MRNGAWCLPRVWNNGLPLDLALSTRFTSSLNRLLPSRVFACQLQKAANARFDHALYRLRPNHDITAGSVVINDDLPGRVLSGSVQVRPGIARLTSSGVQFTDGTYIDDVDAVICATGNRFGSTGGQSLKGHGPHSQAWSLRAPPPNEAVAIPFCWRRLAYGCNFIVSTRQNYNLSLDQLLHLDYYHRPIAGLLFNWFIFSENSPRYIRSSDRMPKKHLCGLLLHDS